MHLKDILIQLSENTIYKNIKVRLKMEKYYFNFHLRTEVGLVRDNNEDAIAGSYNTLVVADGVGGYPDGEVASSYVVEEVIKATTSNSFKSEKSKETISDAVHQSRIRLYKNHSWGNTTMVAAVIDQDTLHIANIGDSRGYLFRDGCLIPLTKDQSVVQRLIDIGEITEEESLYIPSRNIVSETIHGELYKPARIDFSTHKIQRGDIIMLCTDGLTDLMINKKIEEIINNNINKGLEGISDSLIDFTFNIQDDILIAGKDNTTIALGEVKCMEENNVLQEPEIHTFYNAE